MKYGTKNIVAGRFFLAALMLCGFGLIYLRGFAPGNVQWIAEFPSNALLEPRLAHVHGHLAAVLTIMIGFLLPQFSLGDLSARRASWFTVAIRRTEVPQFR